MPPVDTKFLFPSFPPQKRLFFFSRGARRNSCEMGANGDLCPRHESSLRFHLRNERNGRIWATIEGIGCGVCGQKKIKISPKMPPKSPAFFAAPEGEEKGHSRVFALYSSEKRKGKKMVILCFVSRLSETFWAPKAKLRVSVPGDRRRLHRLSRHRWHVTIREHNDAAQLLEIKP